MPTFASFVVLSSLYKNYGCIIKYRLLNFIVHPYGVFIYLVKIRISESNRYDRSGLKKSFYVNDEYSNLVVAHKNFRETTSIL